MQLALAKHGAMCCKLHTCRQIELHNQVWGGTKTTGDWTLLLKDRLAVAEGGHWSKTLAAPPDSVTKEDSMS